ncbi:hypothetical protein HHK36_032515 [Tetracentron sinense]|uniref:Uncharacterized protein n=1 Tax=Tetracentron sinense TaxID=13715 RepID=A0A834Y7S6_TETSI|nr:hypothetical protein HHK36_032515 [Tetracentron sinense]
MSIPSSSNSNTVAGSNASASSQFTYSNGSYFPLPFHLQQSDPMAMQQYPNYLPQPSSLQIPPPPMKIPPAPVVPSMYPAPAPGAGVYSLPQYQQAQQLFQRDAQTITPEALESVKAALASSEVEHKAETKKKAIPRKAAGQSWEDPTLTEWPESEICKSCKEWPKSLELEQLGRWDVEDDWEVEDDTVGSTHGIGVSSVSKGHSGMQRERSVLPSVDFHIDIGRRSSDGGRVDDQCAHQAIEVF